MALLLGSLIASTTLLTGGFLFRYMYPSAATPRNNQLRVEIEGFSIAKLKPVVRERATSLPVVVTNHDSVMQALRLKFQVAEPMLQASDLSEDTLGF